MKGLTVNAQLFLFLRVDVIVGGALFIAEEDWEQIGRLKPIFSAPLGESFGNDFFF